MVEQWSIPQTESSFLANLIPELQWMDLQSLHSTLHRVTALLDTLLERLCALLDRLIDEISKLAVRHNQLFSCVGSYAAFACCDTGCNQLHLQVPSSVLNGCWASFDDGL